MTLEQAQLLCETLEGEGYDAVVYENYSGRGMYGSTVTGIVASANIAMAIGWYARELDINVEDLPRRTDSMGFQTIYY